jgi:hypothetical protein
VVELLLWHMATLTILALATGFGWSAHSGTTGALRVRHIAQFGFFRVKRDGGVGGGIDPLRFPSTTLFALTAACGFAGLAL